MTNIELNKMAKKYSVNVGALKRHILKDGYLLNEVTKYEVLLTIYLNAPNLLYCKESDTESEAVEYENPKLSFSIIADMEISRIAEELNDNKLLPKEYLCKELLKDYDRGIKILKELKKIDNKKSQSKVQLVHTLESILDIKQGNDNLYSAREIFEKLGIFNTFSKWFFEEIDESCRNGDIEYLTVSVPNGKGKGRNKIDFRVSQSFANTLACTSNEYTLKYVDVINKYKDDKKALEILGQCING